MKDHVTAEPLDPNDLIAIDNLAHSTLWAIAAQGECDHAFLVSLPHPALVSVPMPPRRHASLSVS